jgi:lipoprotein
MKNSKKKVAKALVGVAIAGASSLLAQGCGSAKCASMTQEQQNDNNQTKPKVSTSGCGVTK